MTPYRNDVTGHRITNKHSHPSWWFVKIRLKFCLFVLLVLPCTRPHPSSTLFFVQKQPNIRHELRPNSSDAIRTSPIWTSLLLSVPNNHTQNAPLQNKESSITFDSDSRPVNDSSAESTLFRRGREAHRTFMQRIAPHRIAPPPVPKLPPSRTHILQKRPHHHFHEHPHILKHQTLTGAASIASLSSSDLGLPDSIANEYIDGVNPPKFFGRPETDVFDHYDDVRKAHKNTKKKNKPFSTPTPKLNTVIILPNSQTEVPLLRPILKPDNNNYSPSPVRSANDSINSILNHIRAKQKSQDEKQQQQQQLQRHHSHHSLHHNERHEAPKQQQNTEQTNVHVGMSNGEFRPSSMSHPPAKMTPVSVSVSPEKAPPSTESQKSSTDPHSSMKLDLSLMLKQEFDAKNAELNRTSLFTIDDSALDHFRLVGQVPSSPSSPTSSRSDRDRLFYSGAPRIRPPPSSVVVKKANKRPTVKPNFRPLNKKTETKNYHRIKPQRRPTGNAATTTTTSATPIITTEEVILNLSHAPATTNVRWEPPKDISLPTPGSTAATDIRSTTSTDSPINEFELTFNDLDLNVDESRHDMGTNHSKIDWFATFDTGRRRRVNIGANDTLGTTIPGSASAPFRLTTERLAYILIGSCCGLSLLCLIVVAMSVRCRDVCDDYQSWKSTDKRWQQRRLRPGVFVRPPGPQSFFPYPSTLLRATGVLPRYLRAAVMGDKLKINEQSNPGGNMNNSPNGQCCHCVNCSSTWFFRDVKQGDWCCQRGYLEPPKRNKLPFGAASTVNTFMATKDNDFAAEEHETRPKRLMIQDEETEEDEDFDEQPEDDEGDEIATDFSNMFDTHHHMHLHYNPSTGVISSNEHMSPGRNKLKPSQLEPFECSQHEQMRHKSDDNKQQESGKSERMEKSHRKNPVRRETENVSNSRTRFAVPKQLNVRRQQQQKHGITKASSSHHRARFKVQHKPEPSIVSFLHPPNVGPYERPVLHHHFDPIVGPMVFTGRYPDLGPPPPTAAAHLHHLRAHSGALHPPNVSVIWNSNDSERLI